MSSKKILPQLIKGTAEHTVYRYAMLLMKIDELAPDEGMPAGYTYFVDQAIEELGYNVDRNTIINYWWSED